MVSLGDNRGDLGKPGDSSPVDYAWDARLMRRRHTAAFQLTRFLGMLWLPTCLALVPCCIMLIILHAYWSHSLNANGCALLDMEQFQTWAWVVHTLLFAVETVLATLVLTVFFRKLVFLLARWRVRLVTSRLYLSDLPLMIADQCYRAAEVPEGGKVNVVTRGRLESLGQVIDEVVRHNDRIWQRAGKDHRSIRRVCGEGLSGSGPVKAVYFVAFILVVQLLLSSAAGMEILLPIAILLVWLALPLAWFGRRVLVLATEIAVCDFLVENLRSEYYRGWSMPVRRK